MDQNTGNIFKTGRNGRSIILAAKIYTMILAYKGTEKLWNSARDEIAALEKVIEGKLDLLRKDFINLRSYRSLRYDSDFIFWVSSHKPEDFYRFKAELNLLFRGMAETSFSMLSIYEHSPYLKGNATLEDTLHNSPSPYFVAYPMSKTVDWYLIDYEERKRILAEHIGMAVSHPENRDIRSYTTYSFGLGDQEFVVLYEVDDLSAWSHVTEKLREATARKWIIREWPILVGTLNEPFRILP